MRPLTFSKSFESAAACCSDPLRRLLRLVGFSGGRLARQSDSLAASVCVYSGETGRQPGGTWYWRAGGLLRLAERPVFIGQ
jgi:hypothetical protein